MPRNKKTSPRERQQQQKTQQPQQAQLTSKSKGKGKDKDDDLTDSQSDEDILLKAFDAWTHVFLNSYLSMDDPLQQLRIEHDDLEYQWGRFMRGQNGLDPNPEFTFLENHHILEFGLQEDFIQRHDLAVMVMALCMRENQDMGDYSPIEDLARRWEQKTRRKPNPPALLERISDSAMAWMFDIATRAALDINRLYGLYQNTLKLIIRQLEEAVHMLNPPLNNDGLVDNLMDIRNNQLTTLYQKFERLSQPAVELIDPDWFEETEQGRVFAEENASFSDDEGEGEGEGVEGVHRDEDEDEENVGSGSAWQEEQELLPVLHLNRYQVEALKRKERLRTSSPLQQENELKEETPRKESLKQDMHKRHDILHEPTHDKEVVPQEPKLEPSAEDVGLMRGAVDNERQESFVTINDIVEKTNGVVEKDGNVQEKPKSVKEKAEEGDRNADTTFVDDEEEEEPLKRRRRLKQVFDPYSTAPDRGSSAVRDTAGLTISFARSGSDNVAQESLSLSKSIQMRVAQIREQDLSRSSTMPAAAVETAPISNIDSQHDSTSLQKTTQQKTESSIGQTHQLEQQPLASSSTLATNQEPAPESISAAPKPVPEPELQSEPDPFIRPKKTKTIFKAPSESEFEDDDDVPFRELKRTKTTLKSMSVPIDSSNQQSAAWAPDQDTEKIAGGIGGSNSNGATGPSISNNRDHSNTETQTTITVQQGHAPVTSVAQVLQTARRTSAPREKRRYRPWSKEEVRRLMELAPRFFHDQSASDGDGRRRKVKWAKLKMYDEHHGNLLKYRTQVNLKDKYREQTDEGQHRQEVAQINQAKADATPRYRFPKTKSSF
ncbi:hypothetical protein EC991_001522 [Linnemannia zychae]|nr:hypothetical protein EC991_001522 [Linnemannia zychae]